MNWTEGTLQRHSRNGSSRIKQKKSLARTRQKLRHGAQARYSPFTFGKPDSATWSQSSANRSQLHHWSPTFIGQEHEPEGGTGSEDITSSGRRKSQITPRNTRLLGPRAARSPSCSSSARRNPPELLGSQDRRLRGLERKRRDLLGQGDWVGTNIQKPLLINFPAQISSTSGGKWGFGQRATPGSGGTMHYQTGNQKIVHGRPWLAEMPPKLQQSQAQSIKLRIGSQVSQITTPRKGEHFGQMQSQTSLSTMHNPFSSPRSSGRADLQPPPSTLVRHLRQKMDTDANRTRKMSGSAQMNTRTFDLESTLQSLKSHQPMAYIEASPATLHQPIPVRMARLIRFGQSMFPALAENARVSNTRHPVAVQDSSQYSESTGNSPIGDKGIETARQSTPIQGPRLDYPPMTDSSHSEAQSLRFLSKFQLPVMDRPVHQAPIPILQDLPDPMKESPYFQATPDEVKELEKQLVSMEPPEISPSGPTRASSESRGLHSTVVDDPALRCSSASKHVAGVAGLWELPAPDQQDHRSDPMHDVNTDTTSSQQSITSTTPLKEAVEPIDKADEAWLAFLEFDDDKELQQSDDDQSSPTPVAEIQARVDADNAPENQSPCTYFTAEGFMTVTTCGSSQPPSLSQQLSAPSVSHHQELVSPQTLFTVPPSDTVLGPDALPTIYEPSPPPEVEPGAHTEGSFSPRHTDKLTYQDNMSMLVEAPATEFSLDQSCMESAQTSTFAKPRPFVGRFAKTPVPQVRPLVQVTHAPPRRGRPKRKARDGRVSIRGIQNYYDDPIDE